MTGLRGPLTYHNVRGERGYPPLHTGKPHLMMWGGRWYVHACPSDAAGAISTPTRAALVWADRHNPPPYFDGETPGVRWEGKPHD